LHKLQGGGARAPVPHSWWRHCEWSTYQEEETINFGSQEVKGEDHMTPKLDLWRH